MQELTLLRDQNKQLVRLEGDQKVKIPRLTSQLQKARKTAKEIHLRRTRNTSCRMRSTAGHGPISTPARPIEVQ